MGIKLNDNIQHTTEKTRSYRKINLLSSLSLHLIFPSQSLLLQILIKPIHCERVKPLILMWDNRAAPAVKASTRGEKF